MKLLLEAGPNFDLKFINNETVLHLACCLGNTDAVRELLKCGADTSARNRFHQTPRDVAISCEHIELAELIPQAGQYYVPLQSLAILA
jgi:ankyrin repeat protein